MAQLVTWKATRPSSQAINRMTPRVSSMAPSFRDPIEQVPYQVVAPREIRPRARSRVAANHLRAEFRELLRMRRRARVVRLQARRFRRETERQRDVEFLEALHLAIEPVEGVGPQTI